MTLLSSKIPTSTATSSGGYLHIILPYLTTWKSWAISVRRLLINTIDAFRIYDLTGAGNYTFTLEADSYLDKVYLYAPFAVDVRIGTTAGGNDILDTIRITGFQEVSLGIYYAVSTEIYVTYTGGVLKMRLSFFNEFFELL